MYPVVLPLLLGLTLSVELPIYVGVELPPGALERALAEADRLFDPGGIRFHWRRSPDGTVGAIMPRAPPPAAWAFSAHSSMRAHSSFARCPPLASSLRTAARRAPASAKATAGPAQALRAKADAPPAQGAGGVFQPPAGPSKRGRGFGSSSPRTFHA